MLTIALVVMIASIQQHPHSFGLTITSMIRRVVHQWPYRYLLCSLDPVHTQRPTPPGASFILATQPGQIRTFCELLTTRHALDIVRYWSSLSIEIQTGQWVYTSQAAYISFCSNMSQFQTMRAAYLWTCKAERNPSSSASQGYIV